MSPLPLLRALMAADLAESCARLGADGAQLLTFFGADERARTGEFALYVAFLRRDGSTDVLRTEVDPMAARYPSVTPALPAAHWDERELADMLGVIPEGHPDPRPLVRRPDWPHDVFPLRKDFDPSTLPPAPRALESFETRPVEGEGVVEIPVGPIHAGIIEPGHFRFAAIGELVLQLEARLFYTHRGIEKLAEGRTPEQAVLLAERVCGACALSHSVAFCEAVESLASVPVPPRAQWARTILLELERLYNHVGDAGNICAGTGFALGTMRGAVLKERLQQLNERLVGHRFLRGACTPGGLRRDLETADLATTQRELEALHHETRSFTHLLVEHEGFVDRLRGTGRLEHGHGTFTGWCRTGGAIDRGGHRFAPRPAIRRVSRPAPCAARTRPPGGRRRGAAATTPGRSNRVVSFARGVARQSTGRSRPHPARST